jgi:hypothetical protein
MHNGLTDLPDYGLAGAVMFSTLMKMDIALALPYLVDTPYPLPYNRLTVHYGGPG